MPDFHFGLSLICVGLLLCSIRGAFASMTSQRLFIHFSDDREDILRFRLGSDSDRDGSQVAIIESIDQLRAFVDGNAQCNMAGIAYDVELFDAKTGRFGPISKSHNNVIGSMKSLRVLIKPVEVNAGSEGSRLAIDGRRFNAADAITIGGMALNIVEHHECYGGTQPENDGGDSDRDHMAEVASRGSVSAASCIEEVDGNTGLQYWDSAIVMAKFLEKHAAEYVLNRSILELGGGTGVVGIGCYFLGVQQSGLGAGSKSTTNIVVTDLPYAVPNLVHNIKLNNKLLVDSIDSDVRRGSDCRPTSSIFAADLDWNSPEELRLQHSEHWGGSAVSLPAHFDVIMGSDVIWLEHLVPCLVRALVHFGSRQSPVDGSYPLILLAHQTRTLRADDLFFRMMGDNNFSVEEIQPDQYHPQYQHLPKIKIFKLKKKTEK